MNPTNPTSPIASPILLVALSLLGIIGCSQDAIMDPIKIGVLGSRSGEHNSVTLNITNSMYLAVSEINDRGGVLDRDVKLVFPDVYLSSQSVSAAYNELIDRGVSAIIGPYFSADVITLQNSNQIRAGGTVMISGGSTAPALTDLDDGGFFFRTVPPDQVQGRELFKEIKRRGVDTLCVVYRNDLWGRSFYDVINELRDEQRELSIVPFSYETDGVSLEISDDMVTTCDEDMRTASNPGIAFFTFVEDGRLLIDRAIAKAKDESDHGWKLSPKNVFLVEGNKSQTLFDNLEDPGWLVGAFGTAPSGPDPDEESEDGARMKAFQERFNENYGRALGTPTNVLTEMFYDATYAIAAAIEIARSDVDHGRIRDALAGSISVGIDKEAPDWQDMRQEIHENRRFNYMGPSGNVDFDENGDPRPPYFISTWSLNDRGEIVEKVVKLDDDPLTSRGDEDDE